MPRSPEVVLSAQDGIVGELQRVRQLKLKTENLEFPVKKLSRHLGVWRERYLSIDESKGVLFTSQKPTKHGCGKITETIPLSNIRSVRMTRKDQGFTVDTIRDNQKRRCYAFKAGLLAEFIRNEIDRSLAAKLVYSLLDFLPSELSALVVGFAEPRIEPAEYEVSKVNQSIWLFSGNITLSYPRLICRSQAPFTLSFELTDMDLNFIDSSTVQSGRLFFGRGFAETSVCWEWSVISKSFEMHIMFQNHLKRTIQPIPILTHALTALPSRWQFEFHRDGECSLILQDVWFVPRFKPEVSFDGYIGFESNSEIVISNIMVHSKSTKRFTHSN